MLERVVDDAVRPCLGVNSICEFGRSKRDLAEIHETEGRAFRSALVEKIQTGQSNGELTADLDPETAAQFLVASIAGIRIAARGGADRRALDGMSAMVMRALW